MLRLRTLGGISLLGPAGQPLTGAVTQRRLLALLTVLAVAGDRGSSREKLVALLWPEADEERARHSLTQALYDVRRALGVDDLFVAGGDIRLNPPCLGSDVQEMAEALDKGDLEGAVALYAGPFADGFFLPGSTEFEQWTSFQRAYLEDQVARALDQLGTRAEEAGELTDALHWRKRLAAIRPLDTSATLALMTTFATAGNRAGALQHARVHETLLKDQLGLHPDPAVTALVARLREPAPPASRDSVEAPAAPAEPPPARALDPGAAGGPEASPYRTAFRAHRWWSVPLLVGGLTLAAALLLWRTRSASKATVPAPLDQRVVVAPFRVAGAGASLAYLREGMVELLSTRLADDSGSRSVDAGAVLAAWRAGGLAAPAEVSRSAIVELARGLGAEEVVIGSVVGEANRLVLSATVVEIATQRAAGRATVEGPADSISALVDRLAAQLLLLDAGEEVSLASRTTGSLPALRAFLRGQAAFRRGDYVAALESYNDAVGLDSTFALAAVQLVRASGRLYASVPPAQALGLAWRERDALDARARALLVGLAGPDYPMPTGAGDQVDAWERMTDLTPDRAEAWFELGKRMAQEGAIADEAGPRWRAVLSLRHALQLEPEHSPARELLETIDTAAVADAADPALPLAPFLSWRRAVVRGDSGAVRRVRSSLPELGPRNLRAIALTAQFDVISLEDARLAIRQLRARATRAEDRLDAVLAEHALALNQGRVEDALSASDRLSQLLPNTRAHVRLRILDGLYGDGDPAAAVAAAEALAAQPSARADQVADACVLAQWRLQQGDTTGVRQTLGWLRAEPLRSARVARPITTGPLACAELLTATLSVVLRQPEAPRLVARLDSLAFTPGVSGDAIAYAPVLIARLHERLGNTAGALRAIRRRAYLLAWPRYLATQLREEGRYAAETGASEQSRTAFRQYLMLRARPDTALRHQVQQVRDALQRPLPQ